MCHTSPVLDVGTVSYTNRSRSWDYHTLSVLKSALCHTQPVPEVRAISYVHHPFWKSGLCHTPTGLKGGTVIHHLFWKLGLCHTLTLQEVGTVSYTNSSGSRDCVIHQLSRKLGLRYTSAALLSRYQGLFSRLRHFHRLDKFIVAAVASTESVERVH